MRHYPQGGGAMIASVVTLWLGWTALADGGMGQRIGPVGRPHFSLYTGSEGLSQAVVQTIFQDHHGFLWVGTQAGLNRYDGNRFQVFSLQHGLRHDWINDLAQDPEGRLWVATLDGLSFHEKDRFTTLTTEDGLAHNRVHAVEIDSRGAVWASTAGGVSRFDGSWSTYGEAEGLPSAHATTLLLSRSGRLYAGTDNGLAYLKQGRFVPFAAHEAAALRITALSEDDQGRLWVGTRGQLLVFQEDRLVKRYDAAHGLDSAVVALLHDRYGCTWAGTQTGLFLADGTATRHLGEAEGLPYLDIRSLYEDREGTLWIGTLGGLVKYSSRAFTTFDRRHGLGSNVVRPVVRDRQGYLWVETTGGLSRFDGRSWKNFTEKDGLAGTSIQSLALDPQGTLWVGTTKGLSYLEQGSFHRSPLLPSEGRVDSIVFDTQGQLWCAVFQEGIFRQNGDRLQLIQVPGQSFSQARLLADRQGHIWASGDAGLSRWDGKRWQTFRQQDGLANDSPYFLMEDSRGAIWFGYHASVGFSRYQSGRFHHFSSDDGLTNNAVYSLGEDREGNLWIGTARGVDRFDGTSFVNYGTREGFPNNESNSGGFYADEDGVLWFGTMGGLGRYDPRFDSDRHLPPLVHIDEFRLGDLSADPGQPHHRVGFRENDLRVRVAVLSFINEGQNRVEYRLRGFKDSWTALDGRELMISNLAPGSYQLQVRGRRAGGPWSEPLPVSFEIASPFWRTWWWWAGMGSLLAGLLWLGFHIKTRQVQRRAQELEERVRERTAALKESNEELESFIYTVSHDLKAPVISLQGMASLLEEALGDRLTGDAALYLERIKSNTVHMQRLIHDLLDLSRISRRAEPRETFSMNEVVEAALHELEGQIQAKQATFEVDPTLPEVTGERTRLHQVWTNLLANALNYSRPDRSPQIQIGWQKGDNGHATFFVRDNGVGIPPQYHSRIFDIFYRVDGKYDSDSSGVGLAIVKRILETHRGRIWVESPGKNQGTTFYFTLPLSPQLERPRGSKEELERT